MNHIRRLLTHRTILILIVLLAGFLRFAQLGSNPPSLTWDEVAWGYNAYAFGLDGKDEFGRTMPLDFIESFGDFKPPVYAYLDVLPVKVFGLTEFAVRFPSAFFGTLTVLMTYFLVLAIFWNRKDKHPVTNNHVAIALVSSFLLAISPWHIMLSRGAFEANVASFFLVVGVWSFLEAINRRKWLLILSAICFVIPIYTFNSSRIVAPLLVVALAIFTCKQLWGMKKTVGAAAIVGLFVVLPTLTFLFSSQARLRFQEVNIFSNIKIIERTNQEIANDKDAWWSKIIHNRRLAYSAEYMKHYFDNLSPTFLFTHGDPNPKFSLQTMGQMYLFEFPFLVLGAFYLFRKREGHWWVIPLWLLIGIIPAGAARETPHALRIESTLPTFQILVAYGIIQVFTLLKGTFWRIPVRKAFVALLAFIIVYQVSYAIEEYIVHYPKIASQEWQYGYKEAISYIGKVEDDYEMFYFTEKLGRPYVYFLFHKQYDPRAFRKEAVVTRDGFGFVTVQKFNKYVFDKKLITNPKKTLFFAEPKELPNDAIVIKKFKSLNGKIVLEAYTTNEK